MEMDSVKLQIPFTVLSTRINVEGDTENRVLTPFGSIDMIFRKIPNIKDRGVCLEINVNGDTDHWLVDDGSIAELEGAILRFTWGIAQKHMCGNEGCRLIKLCVHGNGSSFEQIMRCE